jgi:hypothetical protein
VITIGSSVTASPTGAMPTMTAVPRFLSMSTAMRVVAPPPYASKAN